MKKIKITERQARLLENLNTRKVIKITESQYNRILELESELIKSETELQSEESKPDLFKEFIEELYNMNEENTSPKYNNLIKVMEVAGLLENNKIKREAFNNDINLVKEKINKGLNVMDECGSPYMAVEAMLKENDDKAIIDSLRNQLIGKKDYPSPYNNDDIENTYTPPIDKPTDSNKESLELDENVNADIFGAKCIAIDNMETKALLKKNGEYYIFLFSEVKDEIESTKIDIDSRQHKEYSGRDEEGNPTYDTDYETESIHEISTDNIENYLNNPESSIYTNPDFNEFTLILPLTKQIMEKILVNKDEYTSKFSNPYVWYIEQIYNNMENNLDETDTVSSGVGLTAPIGRIGFEEGLTDKIYEALKKKVVTEMDSSTMGNYQYDTPGFEDVNMKGNHKKGKGKTFKKPAIKGGKFVEVKEKCKTFPYCNQGIDAIQINEALKLQKDTENNKLIVISDLEGKAAGQETFKNKALLKQNGFEWNGTNWVIPIDELETAKKTLSLANKVEYIIDSLEDLEAAVNNSTTDKTAIDSKSLLKAKLEQYINDLANATDEVALSAEIRRYLTFFAKFHNYSYHNRILIYIQRPDATRVASYKTWQSKFRQVNKGSKGIMVLAPIISKSKKPEGEEEEDIDLSSDVKGFRAVSVFDISDTSPMDERGEIPETPKWFDENTPSETADILFGAVSEVAKDMGINVTRDASMRGEKGYSAGDHINISSDVEGVGGLSTMIHELAHELMHRKNSSIYYVDNGEGKTATELKELQAESVSYVVLKHYDIPVAHHATYLALWKANKERIQNNIENISKVSQFIINKIDEEVNSGTKSNDENKKVKIDEIINEMINNLN